MSLYDKDFFLSHAAGSRRSADAILRRVLPLLHVRSVLDVGCGIGTWLAAARDLGVEEVFGIDGAHVDATLLQIDPACFCSHDLSSPLALSRRYDLALCMEVAEHLPPGCGEMLIESLTSASDCVLFSAAIPHQLGTGHLNAQWQSAWANQFSARGYAAIDCIRGALWEDPSVAPWYVQNAILYVSKRVADEVQTRVTETVGMPATPTDVIHPRILAETVAALSRNSVDRVGPTALLRNLPRAIRDALRNRLGGGRGHL